MRRVRRERRGVGVGREEVGGMGRGGVGGGLDEVDEERLATGGRGRGGREGRGRETEVVAHLVGAWQPVVALDESAVTIKWVLKARRKNIFYDYLCFISF